MLSLPNMLLTWRGKGPIMLSYLHSKDGSNDKSMSRNLGKTSVLSCLSRLCVLKSSGVARAQSFLRKWNCNKEFLNISIIFIKLALGFKEFLRLWKFHLKVLPICSGYQVSEKAVCYCFKVWSENENVLLLRAKMFNKDFQKPLCKAKSCEIDLDWPPMTKLSFSALMKANSFLPD